MNLTTLNGGIINSAFRCNSLNNFFISLLFNSLHFTSAIIRFWVLGSSAAISISSCLSHHRPIRCSGYNFFLTHSAQICSKVSPMNVFKLFSRFFRKFGCNLRKGKCNIDFLVLSCMKNTRLYYILCKQPFLTTEENPLICTHPFDQLLKINFNRLNSKLFIIINRFKS